MGRYVCVPRWSMRELSICPRGPKQTAHDHLSHPAGDALSRTVQRKLTHLSVETYLWLNFSCESVRTRRGNNERPGPFPSDTHGGDCDARTAALLTRFESMLSMRSRITAPPYMAASLTNCGTSNDTLRLQWQHQYWQAS
jgi:hypothetical protein